jgi:hypothetical protein
MYNKMYVVVCAYMVKQDVQQDEVEPQMELLRQQLESYDPENIYNMDETGLNFRALPNRAYLAPDENRRDIRGSKAFAAKDVCTRLLFRISIHR